MLAIAGVERGLLADLAEPTETAEARKSNPRRDSCVQPGRRAVCHLGSETTPTKVGRASDKHVIASGLGLSLR
jgi:hypothetical protein